MQRRKMKREERAGEERTQQTADSRQQTAINAPVTW
jgi:hypothetical protein